MPARKKTTEPRANPAKKTVDASPKAEGTARPGLPYTVLKDHREKPGKGWEFFDDVGLPCPAGPEEPAEDSDWSFDNRKGCKGVVVKCLGTGDYTLEGYEDVLCVERKGTVDEFAGNLYSKRFDAELERMRGYAVPVVVLEFPMSALTTWPASSRRRRYLPNHLKTPGGVLARFWALKIKHPHVNFLTVGDHGEDAVVSLFKRVIEAYGPGSKAGSA